VRRRRSERLLREEMERSREEQRGLPANQRRIAGIVKDWGDSAVKGIGLLGTQQKGQLDTFAEQLVTLTHANERRMTELRQTVDTRLRLLQEDNAAKLDQMRQTVDERLTATLEKRLGESFNRSVSGWQAVHQGPGGKRNSGRRGRRF
jgi:DNA recombination protein RmuC